MYNSLSKTKLAQLRKLKQKKWRKETGQFLAEGWKCVGDLIGSFEPLSIIVRKDCVEKYSELIRNTTDSEILLTDEASMQKLTSFSTPSEIIGVFSIKNENISIDEDLKIDSGLCLFLDNIQDPGNLGTIIRAAHWFGVERVFASNTTVDIYNPKTIQATMGSMGKVRVVYCEPLKFFEQNRGIPVVGTFMRGENIYDKRWPSTAIIVMGNEGNGISEEVAKLVNEKVTIPPYDPHNHAESLNVGVATSIILAFARGYNNF